MNIKKKFLTLSIRHQIFTVVIIISFLCLFYILFLFTLYANIIVSINARKKREYYFNKYKEITISEIQLQTFLLYQYEQLIKLFNTQIYYFGKSKNDLYNIMISYNKDIVKDYNDINNNNSNKNSSDYSIYYLLYFSNDEFTKSKVYYFLSITYLTLDNKLNIIRNFRIPYLGNDFQTINEYLFINLAELYLYSTNISRIQEIENISKGNFTGYYEDLINNYVKQYKKFFDAFKKGDLYFLDIFYQDKYYLFENYANERYIADNYKNSSREYLNNISYYFNFIDYETGKTFLTDSGNKNNVNLLEQNSILSDYLNNIFTIIQENLDINVIPVFPNNNTIMSSDLCYAFLYKQMVFLNLTSKKNIFNENKLNEIYNKTQKGKSNIGDCILDKKYNFPTGQNAHKILNIKFNKFYSIKNVREISLFKLSDTYIGEDYMCIKYTFPDIPLFLQYRPYYFSFDQLNLYCFKQFYYPKLYERNLMASFENIHYLIILFLLYIWIINIFYLVFRSKQIFIEVVDPINNLIEAIGHLDIKEENMLKYEADDSINELFKLCNDLILGKYKQKIMHDSELDKNIDQYDNSKNNNDYFNLKINRKLIEEMIENKNDYNINRDEIATFNVNENITDNKKFPNEEKKLNLGMRKTAILNRKFLNSNSDNKNLINSIQERIKKTQSIDHTIDLLNKKMSLDINLLKNSQEIIAAFTESEEDLAEMEIMLNYKHLYDITDFTFNYDLKYDNKFISKNSKLLYKSNIHGQRYLKSKALITLGKSNAGSVRDLSSINEAKIRIEDFDKSVINVYNAKSMLFLWYKEAKFFNGEEFLQNNHNKELNNLCNLNIGHEINKKVNNAKLLYNNVHKTKKMKKDILKKSTKKY